MAPERDPPGLTERLFSAALGRLGGPERALLVGELWERGPSRELLRGFSRDIFSGESGGSAGAPLSLGPRRLPSPLVFVLFRLSSVQSPGERRRLREILRDVRERGRGRGAAVVGVIVLPGEPPGGTAPLGAQEPPRAVTPQEPPKTTAPLGAQEPPRAVTPQEPPQTTAPLGAQEPPRAVTPQEPPRAVTPQEPPRAVTPQEPPRAVTPQEPPRAVTPQEPPRSDTPQELPKTTATLGALEPPGAVTPQEPPRAVTPQQPPKTTAPLDALQPPGAVTPQELPGAVASQEAPRTTAPLGALDTPRIVAPQGDVQTLHTLASVVAQEPRYPAPSVGAQEPRCPAPSVGAQEPRCPAPSVKPICASSPLSAPEPCTAPLGAPEPILLSLLSSVFLPAGPPLRPEDSPLQTALYRPGDPNTALEVKRAACRALQAANIHPDADAEDEQKIPTILKCFPWRRRRRRKGHSLKAANCITGEIPLHPDEGTALKATYDLSNGNCEESHT